MEAQAPSAGAFEKVLSSLNKWTSVFTYSFVTKPTNWSNQFLPA